MSLAYIISKTEPSQLVSLGLSIVFLAVVMIIVLKNKFWGRTLMLVVLSVLLLRLLLFSNPLAWSAYRKYLLLDDIGFRKHDVITLELNSFKEKQKRKYLAIGSSQAQAVFGAFSRRDPLKRLGLFSLAGLSPMEYYLFADTILGYEPEIIILYLSEFDLGRGPILSQLETNVAEGFNVIKLYELLDSGLQGKLKFKRQYMTAVVSSILPEYRYSFIYKGLIDKLLQEKQALYTRSVSKISDEAYLKQHLKSLDNLSDQFLDFHIGFLREFIELCRSKGVSIVIVEGQYHPLANSDNNKLLNRKVREKLIQLSTYNHYVEFIPREAIKLLAEQDFRDGYHVKSDVGLEYTKQLINYLENNQRND